jgi:AcrR family transcriptional regulator
MDERPTGTRRLYDSATRRARAAETHERIVRAGSELLHDASLRDWRSLTVRAVARRAGVNERTVYRHFGNERGLHGAIMSRLEEEAGIDLAGMGLDGVESAATRIFDYVATFPRDYRPPSDPTLSDASQRQRLALERAVTEGAPSWSSEERVEAAAALDVLWSVGTYERLAIDWQFDHERAVRTVRWVIALVHQAVVEGRSPARTPGAEPRRAEAMSGNGAATAGDALVAETGAEAAAGTGD